MVGPVPKGGCDNCPQRPSKHTVCVFVNVCLVCMSQVRVVDTEPQGALRSFLSLRTPLSAFLIW